MTSSGQQRARRHHLVPQFYLQRFANDDGRVALCRLGDPPAIRVTSVRKAMFQNEFYTVQEPDGTHSDHVESFLANLEGEAATGFRALLDEGEWPLSVENRWRIAMWVALQSLRGAAPRQAMNELATGMLQMEIAAGGKDGLRRVLEEQGDLESLADLDGVWELMSDFDDYTLQVNPNEHVRLMLEMLPGIARVMLARKWMVVTFERKALMTCDEPVSMPPAVVDGGLVGVGSMNAPHILVPLSRRVGLWLNEVQVDVPPERWFETSVRHPGTTWLADRFNQATLANARRSLVTHPDDQHLLEEELPAPRTQEVAGFDLADWDTSFGDDD